ncbi:peptidase S8/S53 domain-containing protein [Annulohypoxylon truncatum]|uniref:peptidase S8/S53 domain-containing protein n=1 Tax=Annulohypoxylon truncatum TaxID=327061 RepID=UPI002007E23C|nr:peptidase S8/S53 domain-containing protein [Annulohypoxylon truncatum]KAI1204155.1 peptidase S8/S53 domain-containing protein [Annulohypoxylon truncatum]
MRTTAALALLPLALAEPSKRATPALVIKPRGAQLIDGKYIVKMKTNVDTDSLHSSIQAISSNADFVYNSNDFKGFASSLSAEELEALQNNDDIDYIEQDAVVTIKATQEDADWGLARLSNSEPGSTTYTYDDSAGEGTCAYVIDTGIEVDHEEFEGRATWLANYAGDGDDTDGNGHGTHVAGTIGSKTYGVSKKTSLFAVKVLDASGSGTNSGVIAGMDFVAKDAAGQTCPKGVVVNMSLGGSTSSAVNEAAASIVNAGLFLAVAAGNDATDASTSSPASEQSACTVGATTKDDEFAEYSNYGSLVDILAPGTDIESTWIGGTTNTISGTSMASPHIAGLGAYYLGLDASPVADLCDYIAKAALSGAISGVPSGTANSLANNGESS